MAALSAEFGDDLAILAFPTGEFGGQELPTDEAIRDFAYGRMNFPQPPHGILLQKKNLGDREAWQAMQFESGASPPTWTSAARSSCPRTVRCPTRRESTCPRRSRSSSRRSTAGAEQ